MQLQKKYLEVFYKVVKGYKTPKMALGRIRDSFLRDLGIPTDQFIQDRNTIYTKFCKKHEDGTPDLKDDKFKFEPSVKNEIEAELETLALEEVTLTCPPETKTMIEESSYETESGETILIDEIIAKL